MVSALSVCGVIFASYVLTTAAHLHHTSITDVINVSGHRLSTAEIESALILHPGVAETAVIGAADDLTGQAVSAFVTLKPYVLSLV